MRGNKCVYFNNSGYIFQRVKTVHECENNNMVSNKYGIETGKHR